MSRDGHDGEGPVSAMDPSLAAAGGDAGAPFPDTATGTRLVLYQTGDGAVDLRWHIDPADIAHARAAFGGAEAHAVLRLHRISAGGEDRLMADADIGTDADAEGGLAHYARTDAEGLLQAEIGLASKDGGWLLVARSNGLPVAAPVGVAFLREQGEAPGPAAAAGGTPGAAAGDDAVTPDAAEPPEALRLQPEFPLVEPVLSPLADAGMAPGAAAEAGTAAWAAAGAGNTPGTGPLTGGPPAGGPPGEQQGGQQGGGQVGDGGRDRAGHRGEVAGAGETGMSIGFGPAGLAARLLGEAGGEPRPEPPPGGVVPRLTGRPGGPAEAPAADRSPAAGSGPLRVAAGEATLSAELVVHGSAPPDTLLDLGGHAYRVGPGGRFLLRIPIRDREVIMRVLATLPWLPVAPRDEAADDAEGD